MTSEIKQRIEQIRRGEVPEEYKKIHGDIVPFIKRCFLSQREPLNKFFH